MVNGMLTKVIIDSGNARLLIGLKNARKLGLDMQLATRGYQSRCYIVPTCAVDIVGR